MKLIEIEIRNFRSIIESVYLREQENRLFTFVGANGLGKSNILRAINLFFNKEVEPGQRFNPSTDLPQGSARSQGRIVVTFKFDPNSDKRMTSFIDGHQAGEFSDYRVPIALALFPNGTLQYTFTVARGRKKNMPDLLERILDYVNCIYVPSIKDYKTIIDSQMMRKIVAATFQGWGRGRYGSKTIGEQKEKFQKLLGEVQKVLDESGDYVSNIISAVIPTIRRFSFSLPYDNLEDFLGRLLFTFQEKHLSDRISLSNVGSGIQSFTIYTLLRLLHEIRPTNTHRKSHFIWLIEEPETFMHHDLQRRTRKTLKNYARDGHIFITTHSPVFIEKQNYSNCFVVTRDSATRVLPINSKNVREVIAGNLGVAFEDFLPFKRYNILVEGESDKTLLCELNNLYTQLGETGVLDLTETDILVCGSATSIPHFYNIYNVFNHYADFLALFDRDSAGMKAREDLLVGGARESDMILIPSSAFKKDNEIEELVGKTVWDACVRKLDADGLISVETKQNEIIDYSYLRKDRTAVKKKFVKYILEHAKKDIGPFAKYKELLKTLAKAIAQKKRP